MNQEKEWLKQALRGDKHAFGCLVANYDRPVRSIIYGWVKDADEIDDIAQEVFLKAYVKLNSYDPDRKFSNWLFSIASNHAIDRLRKRRLQTIRLENLGDSESFLHGNSEQRAPETAVLQAEWETSFHHLINQLPPLDRDTVILRYWNDFPLSKIASMLDITVSAVKARLFRSRKQLAMMSYINNEQLQNASAAFGD